MVTERDKHDADHDRSGELRIEQVVAAMIRLSVPLFRSLLMASKPMPIPSNGPKKPTNPMKVGRVPSERVNSFRMTKSSTPFSEPRASRMLFIAV